ncbi:efflux RND transporter permease subunit [Nocardiopsis kunsanensis]|uniref:efflux RND transporter permease subunit n=1 Tax=Nocardiopsis kunsanensis TaxID=141693 RepID=UPI00037A538A|nr:efflux RND transporter permease subunit [Nocardiopsis kunsanensis]
MVGLTRFSIVNRILVVLLSIVVVVFGFISISAMKVELFPSLDPPSAHIYASYPGASPEVMGQEIAEPIESSLESLDGLDELASTSTQGLTVIEADFEVDADAEQSIDGVRQRVNEAQANTPENTEVEVMDQGGGEDDDFVLTLSAGADESAGTLSSNLDEHVVPALEEIGGVRQVDVWGDQSQYIEITPDEDELEDRGLSMESITSVLEGSGLLRPGGDLTVDEQTLAITVGSDNATLEDLEALHMLPEPDPADPDASVDTVRLDTVADVEWAVQEEESYTRGNGSDAVSLTVYKERAANIIEVSQQVHSALPALSEDLGSEGELFATVETAPFIEDSIDGLVNEGLIGLVAVIALIMLFLMSVRTTLVTLVSIPLSLLAGLVVLWLTGNTLNILTLAGLTAAIGRVVDDSIVVLENIKRHLSYGGERLRSIVTAVREVAGAVTSSTLATAAVFLPLAFIGGELGLLFQPFGIAMSVALLSSLVVAFTVVPLLAHWFLKDEAVPEEEREEAVRQAQERERKSWIQRAYLPLIKGAVHRGNGGWRTWRRWGILTTAFVLFIASIVLATGLRFVFLEDSGQNQLSIQQELPPGTALEVTDEAAREVEELLADVNGVDSYEATVGSDGATTESHSANFWVTVDPESDVTEVRSDVQEQLDGLDDAGTLTVGTMFQSGESSGNQVEVELRSDDADDLEEAAADVADMMEDVDNAGDVTNELDTVVPGIDVTPIPARAAENGFDDEQLSWSIESAMNGMNLGRIMLGGTERDIMIDLGDAPADLDELRDLELEGERGTVRLEEVADVEQVERPAAVTHTEGERSALVGVEGSTMDLPLISDEVTAEMEDLGLPDGVSYTVVGDAETQEEARSDLGIVLLASIAIVFVIMVATLRSLAQPLILMVSVPLSVTGSVVGLVVTDTAMSMSAGIGMLMLVGIVVTNAIMLIDLINQYRSGGTPLAEAVVEGTRHRLRPILMTSLATMGALVPMAIGVGSGSVFIAQALSIVVIGGLASSTLLTLIVVPTLYMMLEETKQSRRERRIRRTGEREPESAGTAAEPAPQEGTSEQEEAGEVSGGDRHGPERAHPVQPGTVTQENDSAEPGRSGAGDSADDRNEAGGQEES